MNKEIYENTIRIQFEMINELTEKIGKAREYAKTTLKFARLEKDFEKEKILLNFLEILGDKE